MAGPAAAAVDWSNPSQVVGVVQQLNAEVTRLRTEIEALKTLGGGGHPRDPKSLKEMKSFQDVPVWDGSDKTFGDFEFKLHQFLAPSEQFEAFLNWSKEMLSEPTGAQVDAVAVASKSANDKVDIHWMNRELFSLLSLKTSNDPLQITKGVKDDYATRGAVAWHKITREVAGKTGVRLGLLADMVHHPKKITSYGDAMAELNKWNLNSKELAKIEGQQIAGFTKYTTLKNMIPEDLARDLEKDGTMLNDFTKAWNYVIAQIPMRKDNPLWKSQKKKDNDMDIGLAERADGEQRDADEEPQCQPCPTEDGQLHSLKGQGKGVFQGYCGHCSIWGHKRADCRKRIAAEGKGKGDPKEAAKTRVEKVSMAATEAMLLKEVGKAVAGM